LNYENARKSILAFFFECFIKTIVNHKWGDYIPKKEKITKGRKGTWTFGCPRCRNVAQPGQQICSKGHKLKRYKL
jgi:hypothetical protein